MRRKAYAAGLAGLSMITATSLPALALDKRAETVQQGDFVLIGNTLAQDCGASIPAPVTGTLDCSGAGYTPDLAPDVFWRAEGGVASATSAITSDQAQSAATLALPKGATVTHAYLYWAAQNFGMADNQVTIQCLDQASPPKDLQAQSNWLSFSGAYSAVADVKDFVSTYGSCSYLVSGVASAPVGGLQPQSFGYALWWMVVLYKDSTSPHRQLMIFDGLDTVGNGGDSLTQPMGMNIPKGFELFSDAKLGVVGYDGDASLGGDQIKVGDKLLTDATGDDTNFFNSSRSYLGAAVTTPGDLPQLSGEPGSMDRLDLDVVDISTMIMAGDTQLDIQAVGGGEIFELAGLVVSVPAFTDADSDGLSDDQELAIGTSPDDADTDDDGVADGMEGCSDLANCPDPAWNVDTDGDGLINALDPDSDNDGLLDGTELGLDCMGMGTTLASKHCVPDADQGATKTDPLVADTDGGGKTDGSEDANLNGMLDPGETDPTAAGAADDVMVVDTDGDGLSDALEAFIGSNPNDADTDDDGLLDGLEANPTLDTDADGLINVLDVDSDNDALYDGTEAGKDCSNKDTAMGPIVHCIADADPATVTSPVSSDTDRGGATDASEDWNKNGAIDPGETDPTAGHRDDDLTLMDTDGDGLSDGLEMTLGSKVTDKDSDDDGVLDGSEANPADDTDGDGMVNIVDPDSDNDLLFDGTEHGNGCADPDTDKAANHCVKDEDTGKTKTCTLDPDTDHGGVSDGAEDFNKDGVYDIDKGEGDPNNKADDASIVVCMMDSDCGPPDSGLVCEDGSKHCINGCRNVDGSRCPLGQVCSSEDNTVGYCIDATTSATGAGGGSSSSGAGGTGDPNNGSRCNCAVVGSGDDDQAASFFAAAFGVLGALFARRGRARAQRLNRKS